jgi:hypothetical protein
MLIVIYIYFLFSVLIQNVYSYIFQFKFFFFNFEKWNYIKNTLFNIKEKINHKINQKINNYREKYVFYKIYSFSQLDKNKYKNYNLSNELYLGITKMQSNIPEIEDSYNKNKFMNINQLFYKEDKYLIYWKIINNSNNIIIKKIFNYKYNYYFDIIRTNKEVAELMFESEEHIKQYINYMKYNIIKEIKNR